MWRATIAAMVRRFMSTCALTCAPSSTTTWSALMWPLTEADACSATLTSAFGSAAGYRDIPGLPVVAEKRRPNHRRTSRMITAAKRMMRTVSASATASAATGYCSAR